MNELTVISTNEVLGNRFNIYGDIEEPLFKADDVAVWLEHSNASKMINTVDESEKILMTLGTLTNSYSAWFLTEDGLYELLMLSRKPIAKRFKKEVKAILSTIRKTGKYEALPADPRKLMALALIEAQKVIEEKDEQLAIAQPKAAALDRISKADGSLCITSAAKDLQVRPKDLFLWLTSHKWIYRRMGTSTWIGYQEKIQTGYLEHKITTYSTSDGTEKMTEQVRITSKGMARISELLEKEAA